MGKDKEKGDSKKSKKDSPRSAEGGGSTRSSGKDDSKSRDSSLSRKKSVESKKDSDSNKGSVGNKQPKKRAGLFSKFRKSTTDLSEWSKQDEKLLTAIENDDVSKVQNLLAKKGVDPTKLDPKGQTAFHHAAEQGKIEIIDALITHSADLDCQDVQGRTPLCCAVMYGRTDVAERLLREKNNAAFADNTKQAAMHHATRGGSADCVRLLLKYNAHPDQQDKDGRTALHYAACMGYLSISRELVDAGTTININDIEDRTPLMCAAEYGHVQVCELLVKKGASVLLTDVNGNNAAKWAAKGGFTEIKAILDNAPTQANWGLEPTLATEDSIAESDQAEDLNDAAVGGNSSSEVVPFDPGDTGEEEVVMRYKELEKNEIVPESETRYSLNKTPPLQFHSSAKVNYTDEDEENMSEFLPVHNMKANDPDDDDDDDDDDFKQIDEVTIEAPQQFQELQSAPPPPTLASQQQIILTQVVVPPESNVVDMSKYQELEEEHEQIAVELQQVMLENKRLNEKIQHYESSGELKDQPNSKEFKSQVDNILVIEDNPLVDTLEAEIVDMKGELDEERRKNSTLTEEIEQLKVQLSKEIKVERNLDDSWNDSDEEDAVGSEKKKAAENEKKIVVLQSHLMELSRENTMLKQQIQSESARVNTPFQDMDTSQSLTDLRELSQFEGIQLAHEQEVRALRERIGKLEYELQNWSDRFNEAEEDKLTVLEEKVELQKFCDEVLQSKNELEKEVNDLKQSVAMSESIKLQAESGDSHKHYDEIDRLQDDNQKMMEDLEGLVKMNDKLHEENIVLKDQVGSLEEQEKYREKIRAETKHLQQEKQDLAQLMEDIRNGMQQQGQKEKIESIISVNITESDLINRSGSDSSGSPRGNEVYKISKTESEIINTAQKSTSPLASLALEEIKLVDDDLLKKEQFEVDEKKLQDLKKELKKLQDKIESDREEGKAKKKISEVEMVKLNNEKEQMKKEVKLVGKELSALKEDLIKKRNEAETEIIDLKKELSGCQEESKKVKLQFEATKLQLQLLKAEIAEGENALETVKAESSKAKEELDFVEKALFIQKEELKAMEGKLTGQKNKESEEELEIENDKISAKKEFSSLITQLQTLNDDMASKRKECTELESQNQDVLSENEKVLQFKEATQKEVDMLEKERQGLLDEQRTLESMIDSEKEEWERLEHDVEVLRKEKALQEEQRNSPVVVEPTKSIIVGSIPKDELFTEEKAIETSFDMQTYEHLVNENKELSTQNSAFLSEIKELKVAIEQSENCIPDNVYELQLELLDLRSKNKSLVKEVDSLNSEIASNTNFRAECERILTENEHLLKELHDARLDNGTTEIITLKNQNEELQTERQQLETNNDDLQTLIQALQISVNKDGRTVNVSKQDENHNEIINLKEGMSKLQVINLDLVSENKQLKKDKAVLESNIGTLQKASEEIIRDQQQEKDSNDQIIKKLHDDNEKMYSQLTNLHGEKGDLESTVASLQRTLDDVIQEKSKKDEPTSSDEEEADEIRHVQVDLDHTLKKLSEVETENKALSFDKKLLETELENNKRNTDDKEDKEPAIVQSSQVIVANAAPILDTSNKNKTKDQEKVLKIKNEKLSAAIESLTHTNQKLATEIDDLHKQIEVLKMQHNAQLENDAGQYQDEIDRLTESNKDLRSEISRLHVQIEDLKDDNENKLQDLMEEQDMLLEKIKSMESTEAAQKKQPQVIPTGGVSEKDEIIQELETQCEQLKGQIREKNKLCNELKEINSKLEETIENDKNVSKKKNNEEQISKLKKEIQQLKKQVQDFENRHEAKVNGTDGDPSLQNDEDLEEERNKAIKLRKEIAVLKKEIADGIENDKKNREVVNTYRTHLLAAVQDCMDPDVKKSLKHIVTLRNASQV